jgi:hypothetical protein
MKIMLFFMFFLLVSCGNNETKTIKTPDNNVDSTIIKSINNIKVSDTIQRKSDSITQERIVKVITNINYLTNTVQKLKIEKLQLSKQKVRIDTVFIETKKSFWGKEKKTITTKSDSQDIETIDSTTTISDTIK